MHVFAHPLRVLEAREPSPVWASFYRCAAHGHPLSISTRSPPKYPNNNYNDIRMTSTNAASQEKFLFELLRRR